MRYSYGRRARSVRKVCWKWNYVAASPGRVHKKGVTDTPRKYIYRWWCCGLLALRFTQWSRVRFPLPFPILPSHNLPCPREYIYRWWWSGLLALRFTQWSRVRFSPPLSILSRYETPQNTRRWQCCGLVYIFFIHWSCVRFSSPFPVLPLYEPPQNMNGVLVDCFSLYPVALCSVPLTCPHPATHPPPRICSQVFDIIAKLPISPSLHYVASC